MPFLRLTTCVRDLRDDRIIVRSFLRSPAVLGRRERNGLRLDSRQVSCHHGAFLFSAGVLQYVDFCSSNGTRVDGVRIATYSPVDISDGSVICIGPFQIVAHVDSVSVSDGRSGEGCLNTAARGIAAAVERAAWAIDS